jgi:2-dehydro-3-deoxyphosphogluconate aldolase/(4S)-4-hydroxy-2-oxoglutarate aldolase
MTFRTPRGIIVVIRASSAEIALTIARGVAEAGVDAIEITFTVPGADEVIERAVRELDVSVGAGTVRHATACTRAIDAGAVFVVSPDLRLEVREAATSAGIAYVPGALTPTEVGCCAEVGTPMVKLFPVGAVGGPSYVQTLSEPFPQLEWMVSGGIGIDEAIVYRGAGVAAVCMGGALIDRAAAAAGDVRGVARHASSVLSRIHGR